MALGEPRTIQGREVTLEDLNQTKLFDGVQTEQLEKFITIPENCRLCEINQGERLIFVRRQVAYIYSIRTGYLAIRTPAARLNNWDHFLGWRGSRGPYSSDAKEPRLPQLLGEFALIKKDQPLSKGYATEDCEFLEMKTSNLKAFADANPLVYRNIARLILDKFTQDQVRSQLIQTPHNRQYASLILELQRDRGYDPGTMTINGYFHDKDIAGYFGVDYSTVRRNMRVLEEHGAIHYSDYRIEVKDIDLLIDLAEAEAI